MKKTLFTLALFAAPLAMGASTNATTMDKETVSTSNLHFDTNSNDRFDNRDTRTNSTSTPASVGADQSRLDPDITSNKYVDPSAPSEERMTGSSTVDQESSVNEWDSNRVDSDTTLSGSGTETSHTGATSTTTDSANTAAPAAIGTAGGMATETNPASVDSPTATKTSKKAKKASKSHHKKSGSSTDSTSNIDSGSTVYPKSSSSNVQDSYNRDARTGSSTEMPSSSSTPGSTEAERTTGSSTMDSMSGSSRPSGSSAAATGAATGAAAGAAAGSESAKNPSSDSSYHRDLTAQDTSRKESETEVIRKIRSDITANKDLSVNAHNIKIISQNNQIILKGPVADANEKTKVEEIAKRYAGNAKVLNQTMIDSRSGSSTNK